MFVCKVEPVLAKLAIVAYELKSTPVNTAFPLTKSPPDICTFPLTYNLVVPVFGNPPNPKAFPVNTKSFLLKAPIITVLSSKASMIGRPAISLTLKRDPERLSVTENNLPLTPSTENRSIPETPVE